MLALQDKPLKATYTASYMLERAFSQAQLAVANCTCRHSLTCMRGTGQPEAEQVRVKLLPASTI